MNEDRFRILINRIWTRDLTKEKPKVDIWLKDFAPSNDLIIWYLHDPEKWNLYSFVQFVFYF